MNEEWRPVVGYEGLYEVSNTGRVRSLDRYDNRNCFRKSKVLSPVKDKYGYLLVNLYCNGKQHQMKIHRLVAEAFIPNQDDLPQVNHKDEDKTNNNVTNLEWCDATYNNNYGSRLERSRETAIKNGYYTGLSKKEYMNKYNQDNKDKLKEYQKRYYQENKDKLNDKSRIYYQENKDKVKDRLKSYYQNHKKEYSDRQKEYIRKKKKEIQNNV